MKIKPEHYKHIRDTIAANVNMPELYDSILADGIYKDFGKRYRWDCLYKAGLTTWVCDNLYSYMDDDHLDTALKAIVKELS